MTLSRRNTINVSLAFLAALIASPISAKAKPEDQDSLVKRVLVDAKEYALLLREQDECARIYGDNDWRIIYTSAAFIPVIYQAYRNLCRENLKDFKPNQEENIHISKFFRFLNRALILLSLMNEYPLTQDQCLSLCRNYWKPVEQTAGISIDPLIEGLFYLRDTHKICVGDLWFDNVGLDSNNDLCMRDLNLVSVNLNNIVKTTVDDYFIEQLLTSNPSL